MSCLWQPWAHGMCLLEDNTGNERMWGLTALKECGLRYCAALQHGLCHMAVGHDHASVIYAFSFGA